VLQRGERKKSNHTNWERGYIALQQGENLGRGLTDLYSSDTLMVGEGIQSASSGKGVGRRNSDSINLNERGQGRSSRLRKKEKGDVVNLTGKSHG